ncbi:MAG: 3-ketosteroid-delta-1-dehydrogenase [Actinomycetaceae bacterium]|nr:3-ketosteroid-delta-1-dehydrogenase [Actinomycetaceae bacterium]
MANQEVPTGPTAQDITVDLLVVGSGTGMAAALAGKTQGLSTLIIEKSEYVGGSTAKSGGAFWVPPNPILKREGAGTDKESVQAYIDFLSKEDSSQARRRAFVEHGHEAVSLLEHMTPLKFFWAKGYSDYHPEKPGGSALGRTCESHPFDVARLGEERSRLQPSGIEAPVPMPVTGADYRWLNLMMRVPTKGYSRLFMRLGQGLGGKVVGREYAAGGRALAAGLFAGVIENDIPVWTRTSLVELVVENGRASRAIVEQDGRKVTVTIGKGVVLAAGGFDHDMAMRRQMQSPILQDDIGLGVTTNTGDAIKAAQACGADIDLMEEAWWFPAFDGLKGQDPLPLLAERSLPGSLMVNSQGERFINEATDYMTFGQKVLQLAREGKPVGDMWLVFDQKYRNSYMMAAGIFPGAPIPAAWYEQGSAARGSTPEELAAGMGVPPSKLRSTLKRFNQLARMGEDHDFGRGNSAYDRYYGDPTVSPNPNLRPLGAGLYATRVVLSDLGTCGGLVVDEHAQVLDTSGNPIKGMYAIGNNAANVFGRTYPGAGATIGQGLVFGFIAAKHAAKN